MGVQPGWEGAQVSTRGGVVVRGLSRLWLPSEHPPQLSVPPNPSWDNPMGECVTVSWGHRSKAPHNTSVCFACLQARVQDQGVGRDGSFWALPGGLPRLSPSFWRFAGDLWGSRACCGITPASASVFTWSPLCACLCVQISSSYKVASCGDLGPSGLHGDLIVTTSPVTLFQNKVPF